MKKPRILIVEDDHDNLGLLHFQMERGGYEILEAASGRKGLEIARRELPDLILLDLAMPDLDGWTVARLLKSDPATCGIRIVVVSVRSLIEDRTRAMQAGCDAYIAKPMSMVYLAEEVARQLELAQKARPLDQEILPE